MPRRAGDIIAGRWRLERELPDGGELARYAAIDLETGAEAELSEPRPSVRLRPNADAAFARAAALSEGTPSQTPPEHPAIVKRAVFPTDEGSIAVGPPMQGSLAGITLTPTQALDLAAWLGPAVLEASPWIRGFLRPEDILLDPDGVPRLAPNGLPWSQGAFDVPHHMAPELLNGGIPTPESSLYGLGVLLYKAVTGGWPNPARTVRESIERVNPVVPPSALKPETPAAFDALVLGLLDRSPTRRSLAISKLPQGDRLPPTLPPLPPSTAPSPQLPAPVKQRPATQQPAHREHSTGDFMIVADLSQVSTSVRQLAAAFSGFAQATIDQAAGSKRQIVLARARSQEIANELAARLGEHGIPTQIRTSVSTGKGLFLLLGFFAIAGALISLPFAPWLSFGLASFGFLLAMIALSRPPKPIMRGSGAPRHADPQIAPMLERVQALMVQLVERSLSGPIARDLRDDLSEVQERLLALGQDRDIVRRQLRELDESRLRAGLAHAHRQGDTEATVELRARMRRLEELTTHLASTQAELGRTTEVLDDLERNLSSVDRITTEAASDALARISTRIDALKATEAELYGDRRLKQLN